MKAWKAWRNKTLQEIQAAEDAEVFRMLDAIAKPTKCEKHANGEAPEDCEECAVLLVINT